MKKCIPLLAALCLLLCGCTAPTPPVSHAVASSSVSAVSTTTTVTTTAVTTVTTAVPLLRQEGTLWRLQGEWRRLLTPATEKEEQVTAYDILKKLRHKEKELGFLFSGTLLGHLQVEETEYLLCELGHWTTDADGGVAEYETVAHLMVPADLSAGYVAQVTDEELRWDTADNWFKK